MATNPPQPRLPVLVNMSTNERHVLNGPSTTIGREPDNNLVISDDGYVSAFHARIYFDQGRWLVEDLNSSNGTSVNDQPVTGSHPLAPQDVLKFGHTLYRIE